MNYRHRDKGVDILPYLIYEFHTFCLNSLESFSVTSYKNTGNPILPEEFVLSVSYLVSLLTLYSNIILYFEDTLFSETFVSIFCLESDFL